VLLAAYSSGGSNAEREDAARSNLNGLSDNESDSDDVLVVGDAKSAPKQKTFCSELQLHNLFSVPFWQPTAEEKVQLAKYSDPSCVMHLTGKSAVFVVPFQKSWDTS
jgi:hypothetical protein